MCLGYSQNHLCHIWLWQWQKLLESPTSPHATHKWWKYEQQKNTSSVEWRCRGTEVIVCGADFSFRFANLSCFTIESIFFYANRWMSLKYLINCVSIKTHVKTKTSNSCHALATSWFFFLPLFGHEFIHFGKHFN